jgi:cytoskeletal protein RodZ
MSQIGQKLREAREKSGLEIEDVYLKIKISPNIIAALEHDEADAIIDQLYVRKFLKQYADFLGLDGGAIENEYSQVHSPYKASEPEPLKVILPKTKKYSFKFPAGLIKKVTIFIIFVLVIMGITSLIKNRKPKQIIINSPATEKPAVVIPAAIPAQDELVLTIATTEKVWIDLKSDDEVIMKNFLNADSNESWKAKDYFELSVGKPEAITIWLNGQKIDIPKHKKIRKARIDRKGLN